MPLISPTTFFLFVFQMIGAFQLFTEPFVMTRGGPANSSLSVVQYIYLAAFRDIRMDKAAAMAWFLFIFIFAFTLFQNRMQRALGALRDGVSDDDDDRARPPTRPHGCISTARRIGAARRLLIWASARSCWRPFC